MLVYSSGSLDILVKQTLISKGILTLVKLHMKRT